MTYGYDGRGNLNKITNGTQITNYTYNAADQLANVVLPNNTNITYGYDADSNMTTRTEGGSAYTQVFDTQNRMTSVTVGGQVTQFLYDPDGNLVKKIKPDASKTLYVGGIYEVDKTSSGTVTGTKTYYPAAGAMRVGGTLYYMLKDHLGSASVLTDASGNIVTGADTRYYPFGEARFSTTPMLTDKLFTGQREITGLGIYYYGARFYSPKLGRFLSADTIVPSPSSPQAFNRYSYVLNNPIKLIDPSGHKCVGEPEECLDDDGTPINGAGGFGGGGGGGNGGGGNGGGFPPPIEVPTFSCGGMMTCGQQNPIRMRHRFCPLPVLMPVMLCYMTQFFAIQVLGKTFLMFQLLHHPQLGAYKTSCLAMIQMRLCGEPGIVGVCQEFIVPPV